MASNSPAAALLFAALLLFAAASALAQAPAPAPTPVEDPRCPGRRIDELIVTVLTGRGTASSDTLELVSGLDRNLLARCICRRIVGVASIDVQGATIGAIQSLVMDLVKVLQPNRDTTIAINCRPEKGFPIPELDD